MLLQEQSARYWPADKMTQYGDMFVETVKETDNGFYCVREMQITHTKVNYYNTVYIYPTYNIHTYIYDSVYT